MRYIKTYEGPQAHKEKLIFAKQAKERLGIALENYIKKFYPAKYDNGTIYIDDKGIGESGTIPHYISLSNVNIFKEEKRLRTVWSINGNFELLIDILIKWFKDENLFNKIIKYEQSKYAITIFFSVDYLDKIIEAINNLIDSGEVELQINMAKYNL